MNRFDKVASQWDSNLTRLKLAKAINSAIRKNVTFDKNMKMADFGCGTGLVCLEFFEDVKEIIGFDSSKKMLEELEKKCVHENISNVKTVLFDINHDNLPICEFDIIISTMTLHHIKDTLKFIKQSYLALKDGGLLVIADLDKEDGTFHSHGNDGVEHFGFEHESIKTKFAEANFVNCDIENCHTIEKNRDYAIFLAIGKK